MGTPNELHVVKDGNHSLEVKDKSLREMNTTVEALEHEAVEAISSFVSKFVR